MGNELSRTHAEIAAALGRLAGLFKPGMRLTFVARMPGNTECELVVTDDDLAEVAAVIDRRQASDARQLTREQVRDWLVSRDIDTGPAVKKVLKAARRAAGDPG